MKLLPFLKKDSLIFFKRVLQIKNTRILTKKDRSLTYVITFMMCFWKASSPQAQLTASNKSINMKLSRGGSFGHLKGDVGSSSSSYLVTTWQQCKSLPSGSRAVFQLGGKTMVFGLGGDGAVGPGDYLPQPFQAKKKDTYKVLTSDQYISSFFFSHFSATPWLVGSQFSNQGSNPHPPQWKHGVITAGLPGKSQ